MLESPRIELKKSLKHIQQMEEASTFEDFLENWEGFLSRLERTYNKTVSEFQGHSKFPPWNGKRAKDRSKDPLLQYLKQARDASEHTIKNILGKTPDRAKLPSGAMVKFRAVEGGWEVINFGQSVIKVVPGNSVLLSFDNRGVKYKPPRKHAGNDISDETIPAICILAVRWYEEYLNDIECKFGF